MFAWLSLSTAWSSRGHNNSYLYCRFAKDIECASIAKNGCINVWCICSLISDTILMLRLATVGHVWLSTRYTMQGNWQHLDGKFKSVMAIITPCRSDQSSLGLSPYGHLSDGRIQMVLVHNCSVLQYLCFLAAIPQGGKICTLPWSVMTGACKPNLNCLLM